MKSTSRPRTKLRATEREGIKRLETAARRALEVELQVSPAIFYTTFYSKARRIVHQGGQSAGKTVNILAVLATHAKQNKGEVITVTSESMPHLRVGALRDFLRFIYPAFAHEIVTWNKTNNTFYFRSGSILEFKSFEDERSARGPRRTRLFVNEANSFDYLKFFQLDQRTSIQTIIDYNPSAQFWAHDEVIGTEGTELYISDHRHNPFLSEEMHRRIENIKDPELWKVYARGKTGNVKGTIFTHWQAIPDEDFPDEDGVFWGIDYGYENDPTAIVKCVRVAKSIFVHEIAYVEGDIAPRNILQLLKANGWESGQPIYSEHDPEQISQLRRLGVKNIINARKGPGSTKAGIQKIKEYNMFYTVSSDNIKTELKRYLWAVDKQTGKTLNIPAAGFDHLMDATRYAIYTHFFRKSA